MTETMTVILSEVALIAVNTVGCSLACWYGLTGINACTRKTSVSARISFAAIAIGAFAALLHPPDMDAGGIGASEGDRDAGGVGIDGDGARGRGEGSAGEGQGVADDLQSAGDRGERRGGGDGDGGVGADGAGDALQCDRAGSERLDGGAVDRDADEGGGGGVRSDAHGARAHADPHPG